MAATTEKSSTLVSLQMPRELRDRAQDLAAEMGLSFSALVRLLITERLRQQG